MKLLLDENLSPRLAAQYPGTTQVELLGLRGASDIKVWELARTQGYVLVSKDNDSRQRSFQYGAPPKVVWLKVGNAGTAAIQQLLMHSRSAIARFVADPEEALLVLTKARGTWLRLAEWLQQVGSVHFVRGGALVLAGLLQTEQVGCRERERTAPIASAARCGSYLTAPNRAARPLRECVEGFAELLELPADGY